MTVNEALLTGTEQLLKAGIDTARLDTLVLLGDVTDKNRTHLLAHPELELTNEQFTRLEKLLKRRLSHEPLAYIRGKTEFYGREFLVNKDVLEPRPESETIVELLKNHSKTGDPTTIIDIGTGSGTLAITAKLELPSTDVIAVDIDPKCLKVANKNAEKHRIKITLLVSDLLADAPVTSNRGSTIILANLPYVPNNYPVNQAATHEPKLALFGGPDGLDLYRTMFQQLNEHFPTRTLVFTESLPSQHEALTAIATLNGFSQTETSDFIQVFTS